MAKKSLLEGLKGKASALRTEEDTQKQAAVNFIEASRQAGVKAAVAGNHAEAVEKALGILADAGVAL